MKYACLIYANESDPEAGAEPGTEAFMAVMAGHMAFSEKHQASLVGGEALHDTASATAVRVRDGETITTDGPFAETKEHLGGFYLIEAADLDQAVAIAADIPEAARGTVEVRPVMVFD